MCLPTDFKFCTCDPAQLDALPEGSFVWSLYRPTGEHWKIVGKFVRPSSKLGDLSSEWLEGHLNAGNRFDFPYEPVDGDQFMVRRIASGGQYLSFIFRDGKWIRDQRMPFGDRKVRVAEGVVGS